jgi:nucleoside-diphosphate-sugar epimerase
MSKISVFGGTGFIGSNWFQLYKNSSFLEERASITPKYKNILYFRSTNSNYSVFEDPTKEISTNLLLLTKTFANLTKNNTFNLVSSWFVYGKNNLTINSEADNCKPKGFYSISKFAQEQFLESYCETFSINYRILRLCNVIGKDSGASSQKNATEFIINKLKNNEDVNIYKGDNYRNFLHVHDVCRAIKLVTEKGHKNTIYNIGSNNSTKIIDIVDFCKNRLNSKSKINFIDTPAFHQQVQTKDFHMNTDKLYNLGFKPNFSLEKTLSALCD